jgi:enoyl-CoA hydratase
MTVTTEKNGPVTTVVLSRPDVRNAVDPATAAELVAAFESFEADDEARVGVFFGDHGTFCAGADLKAFTGGGDWRGWVRADGSTAPMGPSRMFLSKPVIAAVAGYAVAGGLELALWCDLRVVEEDAVFGVFCRRWGVPLIDGGTVRLPRIVGHGRALDLILTGRSVKAEDSLAFGLANRIVPQRLRAAGGGGACRTNRGLSAALREKRQAIRLRAVGLAVPRRSYKRVARGDGFGRFAVCGWGRAARPVLAGSLRYCWTVPASDARISRQTAPSADRSKETDFTMAKTRVPVRKERRSTE